MQKFNNANLNNKFKNIKTTTNTVNVATTIYPATGKLLNNLNMSKFRTQQLASATAAAAASQLTPTTAHRQ